jgi:hypothetical protein
MMHAQVFLVLFVLLFGALGLLWLLDWSGEKLDGYLTRERTWREIEVRSSMQRHPSFQASLYDWEKE